MMSPRLPDFFQTCFAMDIAQLQPSLVWQHFATLCRIPRPSKEEHALREHLVQWARGKGIEAVVDAVGNLILRKPGSPGREGFPGVILQGHLDMVCQANSGTVHDFCRDPIQPVVREGWLVAENTTLGADNGIGVALGLAALEADIPHPPLEVLLTVDEEAGMGGAHGLAPGLLHGQLLINLDTEAWGEVYLGCAGGLDVDIRYPYAETPLPEGYQPWQIALTGLRGGHSGVNIHEERGNAIKLLIRTLKALAANTDLRLMSIQGGTARNALPREAFATVAFPAHQHNAVTAQLAALATLYRDELAGVETGPDISLSPASGHASLGADDQRILLNAFHAAPHGVKRMSQSVPGVVESSNNLGILNLGAGQCQANFMVRSLRDSGALALGDEIASLFALTHAQITTSGHYPGWTPRPTSPLLALFHRVYQAQYGSRAHEQVIHAGLECGIIGAKYPALDMISFGPTIHGAHAPGEKVEIASVGHCWDLLQALLAAIPETL